MLFLSVIIKNKHFVANNGFILIKKIMMRSDNMAYVNKNYKNLKESYLFSEVAKKVQLEAAKNVDKKIIRMGIGDVTLPLAPVVIEALHEASAEMGSKETFKGYGPEQGYEFLRKDISDYYAGFGVQVAPNEIFISDGAKSDVANVTDLFADENIIAIQDPAYPVYVDTNIMRGRKIVYLEGNSDNGFLPMPTDNLQADIVYLCSPNNPTGAVYTKEQLQIWVDFAKKNQMVILYDAAYECFISDKNLPRSIFEIAGAKECAIEFCSFSKTAGFTGTRCGYTVVPESLVVEEMPLNKMWNRRQSTKFNGVPYIIQKAAAAVFTTQGQAQVKEQIAYYMENARIMAETLKAKNIEFVGGTNSPYIWLKCPNGMKSWEFFDLLLEKIGVVGTPGSGFGSKGEGFFRLTAFGSRENTIEAMERIQKYL